MGCGSKNITINFLRVVLGVSLWCLGGLTTPVQASPEIQMITGFVQNKDLRRVAQASVELRDQEGGLVVTGSTDDAGEFVVVAPRPGVFSVRALQETYRSEYVIVEIGQDAVKPVVLTMAVTNDIALEVVAPLLLIQPKSSSETYSLNRMEIEALPLGSNAELHDVLFTIPGAVNGSLKQIHLRQDHANLQVRIDGVPIPDTVSSTFTDVISPRSWDRADIILGGMEAQFGNRTAAVIDITSKSGTKPGFGSVQLFGGSNELVNPSFEYGGTLGERFRFYVQNSFTTTNRGIDPPTLGDSGFHNQSNRNQTFLRGDYQVNNRNNLTLLFLNSIAKFQIPTTPNQSANATILALLPGFTPVASQDIDESQKETNQYAHLVWRHDVNARQFFSVAGYLRHTRATFETDPLNVLAYTGDTDEPFSAGDQDRFAYSGGMRLDYTHVLNGQHLVKAGFQLDRTQAINKTELFTFARVGGAPMGSVLMRRADSRLIGYREEFWVQDQFTPNDQWTLNIGARIDNVHGLVDAFQISPRIGATFKANNQHAFHAYYGRLFTPPNLEAVRFAQLNTVGTTAEPENLTNNPVKPERAHYFEVGSSHAIGEIAVVQLTGYYKLSKNLSDAGQFGTTPLLNFFAFRNGWQRGIEGSVKVKLTDNLSARGNVAWGQCKGQGLQSGHFLLEQQEINDIETSEGVFCDHMQEVTSSAILTYRIFEHTTVSGQMLFGSGLRTTPVGEKTNSGHADSVTTYNLSLTHVLPLSGGHRLLFGVDVINVFDQQELLNVGEQSIGLGVSHANMPRSLFFRTQWFFDS